MTSLNPRAPAPWSDHNNPHGRRQHCRVAGVCTNKAWLAQIDRAAVHQPGIQAGGVAGGRTGGRVGGPPVLAEVVLVLLVVGVLPGAQVHGMLQVVRQPWHLRGVIKVPHLRRPPMQLSCLPLCLPPWLSICTSVCLSVCVPVCLSNFLPNLLCTVHCTSGELTLCLPGRLTSCLPACLLP
jgi:hypothetical protein